VSLSFDAFGQDMNIASPIIALGLLISASDAADHVVPYEAFGPQAIAYKLIGMEWWQWDNHGDSRPRKYPIKVVIYWGQSLEVSLANSRICCILCDANGSRFPMSGIQR
jgi:hypothetical protein